MNESYKAEPMKTLRPIANPLSRRGRRFSVSFTSFTSFDHRIRLNLHQHFRRNQFTHFHHAGRRTDLTEEFSMRAPDFLPLGDVRHKDARAHDVLQTRTRLRQRRFNVLDRLHCLRAQIAYAHNLPIRSGCRGPGHGDHVADSYRPRVAHNRLPCRTARNILSGHFKYPLRYRLHLLRMWDRTSSRVSPFAHSRGVYPNDCRRAAGAPKSHKPNQPLASTL